MLINRGTKKLNLRNRKISYCTYLQIGVPTNCENYRNQYGCMVSIYGHVSVIAIFDVMQKQSIMRG